MASTQDSTVANVTRGTDLHTTSNLSATAKFIFAYEELRKTRYYNVLVPCSFVAFWCLGSIFSVSVLTKPIQEYVPHWDAEVVPRSLSVQGAIAGIVPIFVGRDLERRGHDFYATVGVIIQALGGLVASFSLLLGIEWYYYLAAIFQGVGYGCLYTSLIHFVLLWHQDLPGATSGILGGALGFGSMSFTGIYYRSAKNLGPHWTFIILPIVVAVASLPVALRLTTPPKEFLRLLASQAKASATTSSTQSTSNGPSLRRLDQGDVDLHLETVRTISRDGDEDPAMHVIELPDEKEPTSILDPEEDMDQSFDIAHSDDVLEDGVAPSFPTAGQAVGIEQKQTWKQKLKNKLAKLGGKSKVGYAKLKGNSGSGGVIDMDTVIDASDMAHKSPSTAVVNPETSGSTVVQPEVEVVYEGLNRSELSSRREMWLMGVIFIASLTTGWGLLSCYSVMFTSLLGFSDAHAASSIVTITLLYGLGRLVWGFVSDSIGFLNSYAVFLIGQSICYTLAPMLAPKYPGLFIFVLCINASLYGGAKVVIAPLANWVFHRENAATATGLSMVAIAISSALGPNVAALCVEAGKRGAAVAKNPDEALEAIHRGFSGFFLFGTVITTVGSLACLILKPLPTKARKIKQTEHSDT